jgi:solute carrier family 5 (sodium-coupled monocarboxylate transporter), member 8/12
MNPSPFVRVSFWTYSIGMTTTWIAKNGISQCCIQRFLSVPSIKIAKKSVWIFVIGLSVIKLISCFGGLIIYTKYQTCDPVKAGKIEKLDQILPLFVMDVASKIPGLPGLFIAGIFSAALSSMSSSLNTIAGTIYEDFIRFHFPNSSEKRASNVMKILVVCIGAIMLSLVFVVEKMGQVFRLNFVISGLFVGTQLGMFSIGMMSRKANTKGVICGAIGALLTVGIIVIGAQSMPKQPALPVRTDGCDISMNVTAVEVNNFQESLDEVPLVFQLSFMYYTILGTIVLFSIALPISWATGGCEPFDERLLTPLIRSKNWNKTEKSRKSSQIAPPETFYEKVELNLNEANEIFR